MAQFVRIRVVTLARVVAFSAWRNPICSDSGKNAQAAWIPLLGALFLTSLSTADDSDLLRDTAPIFQEYCFDCHGNENAEANVNLETLLTTPSFATRFRAWEKVVKMVREKRMPPDDMPQPSEAERGKLADTIRQRLENIVNNEAGRPGRVVMRRLTSAEYCYTVQDLTGLDLDLESTLIGDAVGGEGFTNIGDVQFVQDTTLERYLEAAKLVSSHAVIGSGPLQFFADPGKTGLELSAIQRIQEICRKNGFRTAAGEGGEPFGLDLYPRAFFVAWQFRHRRELGFPARTLTELAVAEEISTRFAQHIWDVLNHRPTSFPLSEITAAWRGLPRAPSLDEQFERRVRQDCQRVANLLRTWQRRLAHSAGDDEEAALLTKRSIRLAPKSSFRANIDWEEGSEHASVQFIVTSATGQNVEKALVVWRNPTIQFRQRDRRRARPVPLITLLPENSEHGSLFGKHDRMNHVDDTDLVLAGDTAVRLEFVVPKGARGARLSVEAELQTELAPSSIVRCTVRDGSAIGDTAADTGEISAILGLSQGDAFEFWKAGVMDFAAALPDISHREPAPSDRDPIPAPFDNAYNNAERNEFHYSIKYHRDDEFLVNHILDDATRQRLQHAWNDLLSSFDYHDAYLSFIARKTGRDRGEQRIGSLSPDWIATLPAESRSIVRGLVHSHVATQAAIRAAQPGHLEDTIQFAQSAWRRPLMAGEKDEIRAFYRELRDVEQLDHAAAIRALLTRILVAPAFLYRIERPQSLGDVVPLSQWELASRLSYFLWSSPPDQELLQAAELGRLNDDQELVRQTRRMLRDSKARRFATEFFGQWFGFYRFEKYGGIDANRFPEFDDRLKSSMYKEAISLFEHILREDRPANEILFASYAYWNQDLARHYNMPADRLANLTNEMQFVNDVGALHRGGLLGLGVVHATTSAPLRTSAVKRGDWILRRVLGTAVPPPPADAGSIPADDILADGKTVRERLVAHRQQSTCVNCHSRIDPLGFAMENFDPIGRWREQYRDGQSIDASGTLNRGVHIDGFEGLQKYLRDQLSKFHRTLCSKMLGYALGRGEILTDKLLIEQMMADLKDDATLSNVATRIVTSPQFRTKPGKSGISQKETHGSR